MTREKREGVLDFDASRSCRHEGPLKDFFILEAQNFEKIKLVLGERELLVRVNCNSDFLPGQEFLRLNFIEPQSCRVVALHLSPTEFSLEELVIIDGKTGFEKIFSRPIYQTPELQSAPDWSIEEIEVIPEQAMAQILGQLDPRFASQDAEGQELKPDLKPAQEIALKIGQSLGDWP